MAETTAAETTAAETTAADATLPSATVPDRAATPPRRHQHRSNPVVRWTLRLVVVTYLFLLVAWPTALVATNTFEGGLDNLRSVFDDPDLVHALQLTVKAAAIAVVINTVFGVGIAILLVRYEFPGKRALSALIDLPLSVSPIVVGLALVLVYNPRTGWLGPTLDDAGFRVMFALPAIVLATAFVSLPLMVREVVPVLKEIGTEQEQAAQSLGANAFQRFRRITLPSIKWAVAYGFVLTLARSLGEFGAVKVVSGNRLGQTRTAPLAVEELYLNFQQQRAYAVAFLLAAVSVACIIVVSLIRPDGER